MKNTLFPILMTILCLVGCNELKGSLQVTQQMTLKDKKGKEIILQPSVIEAKLEFEDKDEKGKEIDLEFKDINGKKKEVEFVVPPGIYIPDREGSFELKSSQSGQAYDLLGEVHTDVDVAGPYNTTEYCTVSVREWVCRNVHFTDREGKRRHRRQCGYEYVSRSGRQDVTYRVTTTTVNGKADIVDGARGTIATFTGSASQSVRTNDYVGTCRW
jgi:hypothetical protein